MSLLKKKAPVHTVYEKCLDCYKCIRMCPVKAIKVIKGQAHIMYERCICCGRCVNNCPTNAKRYRSDVETVKLLLTEGRKAVVSLAPSFVSDLPGWTSETIIAALKQLGFSAVSETALGADFVSAQIARDLSNDKPRIMISSACPAIVAYIKLYKPDLAPFVSPHASPLLAHARFLHSHYGKETAVVFIGPCFAKKKEADLYENDIDASLTFQELDEWLQKERITPESVKSAACVSSDCAFQPRRSAKGAFFPIENGEITAFGAYMSKAVSDASDTGQKVDTVSASGISVVQKLLSDFTPESLEKPLFLELLACTGGCVNGPGMSGNVPGILRNTNLRNYAGTADDTLDDSTLSASPSIKADYPLNALPVTVYSEQEIAQALQLVGKSNLADRHNCGSCGYDTCRELAVALLNGWAEKSMCASYMRQLASQTANGLMKSTPSGAVIVNKGLQIIDCNEPFARIMGEETQMLYADKPGLEGADLTKIAPFAQYFTSVIEPNGPDQIQCDVREGKKIFHIKVFAIEKGETAAGIVDDITEPRVRIDNTVERAQEVIKKNAAVTQQIAFLLGENAAESEAILNSIIESYTAEEEDHDA
ncbi:MAG: 4Fe-4S binding protein [Treponema sp.]|jgi:iron only hydrogenase large subunit-like protein|nr:4Fe-4S binding protein [Treponema sp.]